MIYHGDIKVYDLRTEGNQVQWLLNAGHVVYARDQDAALGSVLAYRIVTETNDKWFEVGIPMLASQPMESGNASAGFLWLNGFVRFHLEWSEDLINWHVGKFADSGTPQATVIDGENCLIYWARSIYSVDSKVKTGHMWVEFSQSYSGNPLNNPLNALTINNIVRNIAGSYTMPGDAAALQAKLRELGFADATVVAVSDVIWRIDLYGINFVAYGTTNKIYWPQYLVADMFGNVNTPVNGIDFQGEFVNANGLRCTLNKQFARMGATLIKL